MSDLNGHAASTRGGKPMPEPVEAEGPDAALRADIRRIGKLLGQTLARQEGPPLLDLVEEIRALVRQDAGAAADRLAAMDVTTGTKLARAFSTYFHLANITEQVHRARDLRRRRARDGGSAGRGRGAPARRCWPGGGRWRRRGPAWCRW